MTGRVMRPERSTFTRTPPAQRVYTVSGKPFGMGEATGLVRNDASASIRIGLVLDRLAGELGENPSDLDLARARSTLAYETAERGVTEAQRCAAWRAWLAARGWEHRLPHVPPFTPSPEDLRRMARDVERASHAAKRRDDADAWLTGGVASSGAP